MGADNELKRAWNEINQDDLIKKGAKQGTKWIFGPANSPWHQGAAEAMVKTVKKCLQFAIHSQRLTPAEYLTVAYEIANLVNERPIGSRPAPDSPINILTPNLLLLGRSTAKNPGFDQTCLGNLNTRYLLVRSVTDLFWKRWSELFAPSLTKQIKWIKPGRNLQPGDIVLIVDSGLKGQYKLAKVWEVFPGADGMVRKVKLSYKRFKPGEPATEYSGASDAFITRSVQRLALIVAEGE